MKKIYLILCLMLLAFFLVSLNSFALAEDANNCGLCHKDVDGSSIKDNFFSPNVTSAIDKNLPPDKTAKCNSCHNATWHPDLVSRAIIDPFGYFTYPNSLDPVNGAYQPFASSIHSKHRGILRSNTYDGCKGCHGTTTGQETYNKTGKDYGPYPNGRVNCTLCHVYVPHKEHVKTLEDKMKLQTTNYLWLAQGGFNNFSQSDLSCTSINCHGGSVEPAVTRADGKQLCVNCHSSTRDGYEIDSNGHVNKPNGIIHNTDYTSSTHELNCNECHAADITLTHNSYKSDAPFDSNKPFNTTNFDFTQKQCTTCHNDGLTPNGVKKLNDVIKSTDKTADTGKTQCDNCHSLTHLNKTDIADKHKIIDSRCQNAACHSSTIDEDHNKRGISCAQCHRNSSNPLFAQAIKWEQKKCNDCHKAAHGILLSADVPTTIPTNPAFTWSQPIDADTFAGENWVPAEYIGKNAKVIISNRVSKVTGNDVWTWYKENMQQQSWTVTSDSPAQGSNFFKVTFAKGNANVLIWFYGGKNHTSGPVFESGYKMEILYYN